MLSFSNSALPTAPAVQGLGPFPKGWGLFRRPARHSLRDYKREIKGGPSWSCAEGGTTLVRLTGPAEDEIVARMKRELESGSGGGQQRPMDRESYVLCHQGRGRSLSAGSQVTLEGGAEHPRRRIRSTRQLPRGQWPGAVNRERKLNVRFGVQSGNQPGIAYAPSEVTDWHKTRGWDSIFSRAFALADQARGCEHDSRDECSYATIQQDFIKDSGHDSLHSIHLDQTVTAKCYEVDKRCELFTSRPRVAGVQQQIESLFTIPY